ncbi:hypothetical protein GRX03_03375 [Halovenus sp. WSH3]|uniref:Peptidase M10A and M12B matrixin and adamalysin n=1 Tax=Halovenus carboxidivorans TaxID=2692199 RepID=A0A6B0T6Y8_9EURY|nr:hypothetical protein [Halovenus carboxidivorans]MXR50650.1 hypothetical protein [Halovenus carboxidivorans]
MRRRQVLGASAAGIGAAITGCLGLAPGDEHPLAGRTQTVRVDARSESPHDLTAIAEAALSFWEDNSEQYAGFPVDFEVIDDGEPDVLVAYRDDPTGCEGVPNYSDQVLGCAPVLQAGYAPGRPITGRVVAGGRPPGAIRITTEHELGHMLGLEHDDEPARIMSNRPEDRIPEYARRIDILDAVRTVNDETERIMPVLSHGISLYNDGEDEAAALALDSAGADLSTLVERVDTAIADVDTLEANVDVETVAFGDLRELLDQLRRRLAAAEGLSTALAASARADGTARESQRERAIEYADEFNSIPRIQLREVAVALGLVQATTTDEPVVEFDGETPTEP